MFGRKSSSDDYALLAARMIGANVMVADENLNIAYLNEAVEKLLKEAEADLKKELPQFSVAGLGSVGI